MIRLLELIFFGHVHNFGTIKEEKVISDDKYKGWRFIQKCKTCGKIKKTTII